MFSITATALAVDQSHRLGFKCAALDASLIEAAYQSDADEIPSCPLDVIWLMGLRFGIGDDMVITTPLCIVHFNALKMSLHEGVGADEDVFGKFKD